MLPNVLTTTSKKVVELVEIDLGQSITEQKYLLKKLSKTLLYYSLLKLVVITILSLRAKAGFILFKNP